MSVIHRRFSQSIATALFLIAPLTAQPALHAADAFPVQVTVDAAKPIGPVHPIWNWFGYDELNYTYLPNGSRLLASLKPTGDAPVYVRAHHMFTTGDGSPAMKWGSTGMYREDAQGNPVYDFTIADRVVDTWVKLGLTPLMELGFMPEALSAKPAGYPKTPKPTDSNWPGPNNGFSYPPKDYQKWGDLCYNWTKHCIERYGRKQAAAWRWQVWNEPNNFYWQGSAQEFQKLYDFGVEGVRRALPEAIIGGPHTAGIEPVWMNDFFTHCRTGTNYATRKIGSPLDFTAFHAKGAPTFVDGHVRMGIGTHLGVLESGFKLFAARPELKAKPVIIGESDPDGGAAVIGEKFGYRNLPLYASYTAASFLRKSDLAAHYGINLAGAVTWSFVFEHAPLFSGQRQLVTQDIDLPVRHVFRMFDRLRGERITAVSDAQLTADGVIANGVRDKPDVGAFATRNGTSVAVLLWHYHDDDLPGLPADVTLSLAALSRTAKRVAIEEIRVDEDHGNPFVVWKGMGSPKSPSATQREQLLAAASNTVLPPRQAALIGGRLATTVRLPRQSVVLLVVTPVP